MNRIIYFTENGNRGKDKMREATMLLKDLELEAELFCSFARLENEIQNTVAEQNWSNLDNLLSRLEKRAEVINKIEEKRIVSFQALREKLGISEDMPFSRFISNVPDDYRDNLTEAYRSLETAICRVKGATARLGYYFKSLAGSLNRMLSEIFPYKKGKIYCRKGKLKKTADDSMVLNQSI